MQFLLKLISLLKIGRQTKRRVGGDSLGTQIKWRCLEEETGREERNVRKTTSRTDNRFKSLLAEEKRLHSRKKNNTGEEKIDSSQYSYATAAGPKGKEGLHGKGKIPYSPSEKAAGSSQSRCSAKLSGAGGKGAYKTEENDRGLWEIGSCERLRRRRQRKNKTTKGGFPESARRGPKREGGTRGSDNPPPNRVTRGGTVAQMKRSVGFSLYFRGDKRAGTDEKPSAPKGPGKGR